MRDLDIACDLRKLRRQVDAAIAWIDSGMPMEHMQDTKVNQGYQIGDFVITPRFPKTDFQGQQCQKPS